MINWKIILTCVSVVVLVAVGIFSLRFIVGGSEDSWICQNNRWVKHGNPSASIPSGACGEQTPKTQENKQETKQSVPPLTEENFIRLFFTLINEKQIPDAVAMLDASQVPNNSAKQSWGVQFNSFKSVSVKEVKPFVNPELTGQNKVYQVTVVASMTEDSASAPIPHYGWENGENTRWITIVKDNKGLWKISGIATGP